MSTGGGCWRKDDEYFMPFPCRADTSLFTHVCPFCSKSFLSEGSLSVHVSKVHGQSIVRALQRNPLETYKQIFGADNVKRVTQKELRYPDGLVVSLEGKFKGMWWSFTEDCGGGPIKAIRHLNPDLSLLDAMLRGAKIAGLKPSEVNMGGGGGQEYEAVESEVVAYNVEVDQEARIEAARDIWRKGVDLQAEDALLGYVYLTEHRGIPSEVIDRLALKFLAAGVEHVERDAMGVKVRKVAKSPAVLVPVRNSLGELVAVQRIYLDPNTGGKPNHNHKFSLGLIAGNAGVVQHGSLQPTNSHQYNNLLVVAEGPETAASLAAVVEPHHRVLASLSLSNLANLGPLLLATAAEASRLQRQSGKQQQELRVIIARDNDLNKPKVMQSFDKNFAKLTTDLNSGSNDGDTLSSVNVTQVLPDAIGGINTDWNDVLKAKGVEDLSQEFWSKANDTSSKPHL